MTDPALELVGVTKCYGDVRALDDIDLKVAPGEFVCLLGPSGCGKTTLLETVGGYTTADAGQVVLGGRAVGHEPPEKRNLGMVFQSYALFPHLSGRQNIGFGLQMNGVGAAERDRRIARMLELVGLSTDDAHRRPDALSGGQQQRVALARALVIEPELLLLDEPFANLDKNLRRRLRRETKRVQADLEITALLVTHNQQEAFELADRIGVIFDGAIAQIGTPRQLYERPRTRRVGAFVGHANFWQVAETTAAGVRTDAGWQLDGVDAHAGATLLVRPEHLEPVADGGFARGRVERTRFRGADIEVDITVDGTHLTARWPRSTPRPERGERVALGLAKTPWIIPEEPT